MTRDVELKISNNAHYLYMQDLHIIQLHLHRKVKLDQNKTVEMHFLHLLTFGTSSDQMED